MPQSPAAEPRSAAQEIEPEEARPPVGEEMARKWYYARAGERYGPVPVAELRKMLEGEELGPQDFVWTRIFL